MQIPRSNIHRSLQAYLNPELDAPPLCLCDLLIYLTHNAYIIGTFRGSGNVFLRLFSLYFHFTLMRLIGIVEVAVSKF